MEIVGKVGGNMLWVMCVVRGIGRRCGDGSPFLGPHGILMLVLWAISYASGIESGVSTLLGCGIAGYQEFVKLISGRFFDAEY